MTHHVTFWRTSVVYQHGVLILNEVVGTEPALDKVLFAEGTCHIANTFVRVGDFAWDPVRGPLTICTIELFHADSFGFEPEGGGPFSLGSYCSILKFTLGVNML